MTTIGGGVWILNAGSGTFIPTFTFTPAVLSTGSPISINESIPKKKTTDFFIRITCLLEKHCIACIIILPRAVHYQILLGIHDLSSYLRIS
jgi:hypothetical protein